MLDTWIYSIEGIDPQLLDLAESVRVTGARKKPQPYSGRNKTSDFLGNAQNL
jgi:hypothetical protein